MCPSLSWHRPKARGQRPEYHVYPFDLLAHMKITYKNIKMGISEIERHLNATKNSSSFRALFKVGPVHTCIHSHLKDAQYNHSLTTEQLHWTSGSCSRVTFAATVSSSKVLHWLITYMQVHMPGCNVNTVFLMLTL